MVMKDRLQELNSVPGLNPVYLDREMLKFGFSKAIDFFGQWVTITLLKAVISIIQWVSVILLIGFAGRLFLGTVPETWAFSYPEVIIVHYITYKIVFFGLAFFLFFELLGGVIRMGTARIALDLYDAGEARTDRLLSTVRLAFNHMAATFLYVIIVFSGLVFFIIPGIFFALRLWFYRQVLIDKQCGPLAALKISADLTCGKVMILFRSLLLVSIVNIQLLQGIIFLLLVNTHPAHSIVLSVLLLSGLLTLPTATLSNAFIYRNLLKSPGCLN